MGGVEHRRLEARAWALSARDLVFWVDFELPSQLPPNCRAAGRCLRLSSSNATYVMPRPRDTPTAQLAENQLSAIL